MKTPRSARFEEPAGRPGARPAVPHETRYDPQAAGDVTAVEAALMTVRDARQRVWSVRARAEDVADETAWQARAAAAYRCESMRWLDGLRQVDAALADSERGLQVARASLATGG